MTPAYDFTGLTSNQRALISVGGWNWDTMRTEPANATVEPLIARGLLVRHYTQAEAAPGQEPHGTVRRSFEVPGDVQVAWWAFFKAEGEAGLP